jgi:hypothetical protein
LKRLFCISTNRFTLDWDRVRDRDHAVLTGNRAVFGRLAMTRHSRDLEVTAGSARAGVPDTVAADIEVNAGPPLFEQTDYQLYLRGANAGDIVDIRHDDPAVVRSLSVQEYGRVVHGVINFRGQIGRSRFSVYVNATRQMDFEVEVFPTKLDYESDYQEILSDIQSILTGLAYEYLRSTFQMGKVAANARPSKLEWLVLLETIVGELETGAPRTTLAKAAVWGGLGGGRHSSSSTFQYASLTNLDQLSIRIPCAAYSGFHTGRTG